MQQPQNMPVYQNRHTPCGVVLMSIFLILQGIFLMISGLFGILGLVVLVFDTSRGTALLTHGVTSFVLGILSIIFSIGMLLLARWAFWAAVVVAALNLVNSLVILFQTGFASFGHIVNAIVSLIILSYFLFNNQVRYAFRIY